MSLARSSLPFFQGSTERLAVSADTVSRKNDQSIKHFAEFAKHM